MILKQGCFLVAEARSNVLALFFGENNAIEGFVNDVVVVEGARILCDDIQRSAKGTEASTVDAVAVRCGVDVWTCLMNGTVDHEGCRVEKPHRAPVDDFALFIHLDEI